MKKKLLFISLIFNTILLLPISVYALEETEMENNPLSLVEEDVLKDAPETTIESENPEDNTTPFDDSVNDIPPVIENNVLQDGWLVEDGNKYYVENGQKVCGFKEIDGKIYFFSNINAALKTGWQSIDGNLFYLFDDGSVADGWQIIDDNKYYFENHYAIKGFKEISGKTYFFSNINAALKTGWQSINGNLFYLFDDGSVADGWQIIDDNKYYFENHYAIKGFKEISGKTYFFSNINAALKTGWQSINGNLFYLFDDGSVADGWQTIDDYKYYFENHYAIKGFKEISGKTYFFSNINAILKTGWQSIDGNLFYLFDDGSVADGWQIIDDNKYYFENHYAVKGFKEIGGATYFFSNINAVLKKGWQSIDGNSFYLFDDGRVAYGWQTIDHNKYYFDNGYAVKGFKEIDGKTYFFSNINAILKTGLQSIDSNYFYLEEDGSVYQNGWKTIEIYSYYFENGYAVKGFKEIDGKTYFFSNINAVLKKGWQSIDGNIFYLTPEGYLVTGNQAVEGRDYYFNEKGFLQGFKYENDKMYYYNPDGTQAKGVQRIAGRYYKFNEFTGVFERFVNQKIVIDVSEHQGIIDWEAVKNSGMVDAVILRLGYVGTVAGVLDAQFLRNVSELNRLGIPYSVYLFGYAKNTRETLEEAQFLIDTIKKYSIHINSDLFSIYYDAEHWHLQNKPWINNDDIDKDTYGDIIRTFVNTVENALGIRTRVYASTSYIYDRFHPDVYPYFSWIADWRSQIGYTGPYEGWQYTSDGQIPGIAGGNGRVDMSLFYY